MRTCEFMKKLILSVALVCAALPAWAGVLGDKTRAIQSAAALLEQRMTATAANNSLTWGQQLALDDMQRLNKAAAAFSQALGADDDTDAATSQWSEFQTAASRVRMTLQISNLDAEAQQVGQNLLTQLKEIESERTAEREARLSRSYAASRPSVGFGLGVGSYWGPGWGWGGGWGWPYYGGLGFNRGFIGRGFYGGGGFCAPGGGFYRPCR